MVPIFYPSIAGALADCESRVRLAQVGRFRECDDCPIYERASHGNAGIAQGRDEHVVTTSGTTATFRSQEKHLTSML